MVNFEIVREEEVDDQNILFCDNDRRANRMWGKLSFSWDYFFIGWRSNNVMPEIKQVGSSTTVIGVDENYAIFSKSNLTTISGLSATPLLTIKVVDSIVALIFEMEVHIYKVGMSTILSVFNLPDIVEETELNGTSIKVRCMDGKSYDFDFPVLEKNG